jgi:hypothetical protein
MTKPFLSNVWFQVDLFQSSTTVFLRYRAEQRELAYMQLQGFTKVSFSLLHFRHHRPLHPHLQQGLSVVEFWKGYKVNTLKLLEHKTLKSMLVKIRQ